MLRMKSLFAVLCLAAFAGIVQSAYAQRPALPAICDPTNAAFNPGTPVINTIIAGSSAMWQTLALGAYDDDNGIPGTAVPPLFHYVNNTSGAGAAEQRFFLWDSRPDVFAAGNDVKDKGGIWIVWDSFSNDAGVHCTPNVWAYIQTDSVVGNRAFFGGAGAAGSAFGDFVTVGANGWFADDGKISSTLWGDGTAGLFPSVNNIPPPFIQNLFVAPVAGGTNLVNVGATDIRPEDAFYAQTRANTTRQPALGVAGDLVGLGYNSNNTISAGTAPDNSNVAPCTGTSKLANLVGTPIASSLTGSTFGVVAFNLTGVDPFTCNPIPAFSTIAVGASPIVFFHSNNGGQLGTAGATPTSLLADASESELEQVFSGQANGLAAGKVFAACTSCQGNFAVYLREPLSGTYNTVEETVMRHPSTLANSRFPMETGIDPTVANNNPLTNINGRYRAIGTGEEVTSVLQSVANHAIDGIGYSFFSFGNFNPVKDSANVSYIRLNGIDPLWHNYIPGTLGITDPGQPATAGFLPGSTDAPGTCAGHFPCAESLMWKADNTGSAATTSYSFPNLRNGSYPSWSVIRLVAATASSLATALVNNSQKYVVSTVPDYVPFGAVSCPASGSINGFTCTPGAVIDPGLTVVRSHFGCTALTCGTLAGKVKPPVNTGTTERGRDAGGQILPLGTATINLTQDAPNGFVKFQ